MPDRLATTPEQRARFEAVRRRIFREMGYATAKWRLYWTVPFSLAVLSLLVARGVCAWRGTVQAVAALCFMGVFIRSAFRMPSEKEAEVHTWIAALSTVVSIGSTGGLASPLLLLVVPSVMGGMTSLRSKRGKAAFIVTLCSAFAVMALLSRTALFGMAPPLEPVGMFASAEYIVLAAASAIYTVTVMAFMGESFTLAYERVALELSARRVVLEGIAARLAHEVKNPLAAIKGLSAHMARRASDEKTAERLAIVAAEAERLQAIVDGFLSFSRGFDDLKIAPTRPYDIARELTLLLEERATEAGITLVVSGNADVTVNADARKLRQALLNLLLNAVQACGRGATVTLDVGRGSGDAARIRVVDQGCGMTAEVMDRIRKPYFTTKEGGSGLGVAVARGLVEQHGGVLTFESQPKQGTTVTIELPSTSLSLAASRALPNPLRPPMADATPSS